jgi:hypothetical protein
MDKIITVYHSYWCELSDKVHELYDASYKIKIIARKCFSSKHRLFHNAHSKLYILIALKEAYQLYSCMYPSYNLFVYDKPSKAERVYSTPHQNALFEDDKEFILNYIKQSRELLDEITNPHNFLKQYSGEGRLYYLCKIAHEELHNLAESVDIVPIIPISHAQNVLMNRIECPRNPVEERDGDPVASAEEVA